MRERKLRSTAESLVRLRESLIPYTHYIYKIQRKVKSKNTMRICSLSVPPLKHEWNQTVWSVNNLRCGTAGILEVDQIVMVLASALAPIGGLGFRQNLAAVESLLCPFLAHGRPSQPHCRPRPSMKLREPYGLFAVLRQSAFAKAGYTVQNPCGTQPPCHIPRI